MNQFFYQITRKASDLINSDDYRERNITRQTAFTRNRKLSFPVMIVLLLNFLTRTMQIELDDFFANVLDAGTDSVTKQAFFKARKNILPDAFKELFLSHRKALCKLFWRKVTKLIFLSIRRNRSIISGMRLLSDNFIRRI